MGSWGKANRNGSDGVPEYPDSSNPQYLQDRRKEMTVYDKQTKQPLVQLEIEKDVPIPAKNKGWTNRSSFFNVLLELEVNESVVIPHKIARQMRNALAHMRRVHPEKRFATRKYQLKDGSFRVWRV